MSVSDRNDRNILSTSLAQLGVALLYLLAGLATNYFMTDHGVVSRVWPGAGLALAALLIGGRRLIWGVLLGSLLLGALTLDSLGAVLGFTLVHVLQGLLGVWLLTRRARSAATLRTLSDYLCLIALGGALASLVGALLGPLFLLLTGAIAAADYARYAYYWWMGDVLGVVLFTPLVLAWWRPGWALLNARQWLEGVLLVGLTFTAGQIVFLDWWQPYLTDFPKGYVMFLFVAWVATRMGTRGTTFAVLLIAAQALIGAYLETGYFADELRSAGLANYWAYMVALSVVGMALATYVSQLRRVAQQLKLKDAALNVAGNSIVITDKDGRIEWANPAFSQISGYSLAEALGRNPRELLKSGRQDGAYYRAMWDTLLAKKEWRGEMVNRRKDGSLYDEDTMIAPMLDAQGTITHYVAVKFDVTERKRLEQQRLSQSRRIEELSHLLVQAQERAQRRFSRQLHERTSPNLAALRINFDNIARASSQARETPEFAERVEDTRALIADTTLSIRDICAELSPPLLARGQLISALQSCAQLFAKRTGLQVRVDCAHDAVQFAPELEFALFHIVQEALTNCAKHAQASAVRLRLQLAASPLRLSVIDDGIGFDPAQVAAAGYGAGQGLLHMRETAEFVGGRLRLVSVPGSGTRIELEI